MKSWVKIILGITLSVMCVLTSIGYAAFTDDMSIMGDATVERPDFDEVVITDIIVYPGTTASQTETTLVPTNVKTQLTGIAGQKIVYQITAHNFSKTQSYIYTGPVYSSEYTTVASQITISTSNDAANTDLIPVKTAKNACEGTPIAPGEDFVFYVTYTLNSNLSASDLMVNFKFQPVIYTVTYMNTNKTYAVDCIIDNSIAYEVRKTGPNNGSMVFANWINASAEIVTSYPAGTTHDYTLSATWKNIYLIIFVDNNGNVIYQEPFTDSSTKLSDEGQRIVDAKLAEFAEEAAKSDMAVTWSEYNIASANKDITVRPVYTYNGNLRYTPVDEDKDGIIDYYKLEAVDSLASTVRILGKFNGLDVKIVEKLYANDGTFDYSSGVQHIIIEEGVQLLMHNSLAYTENLSTVTLPSTLVRMEKNVFSRNLFNPFGNDDKKVITITYNGTREQWKTLVANSDSDWNNGLLSNSKVICTDGYFQLSVTLGNYKWKEYSN